MTDRQTDRQTHGLTFGLLGPKISTIKRDDMMNDFLAFSFITLIASHSSEQLVHCLKCVNDRDLYTWAINVQLALQRYFKFKVKIIFVRQEMVITRD